MKRKNGFFSMSLIYSFFLVFAMLSAILLANYAHNRLLVKDYNVDIKDDLTVKGNEKLAYVRNILNNSDFEVGEMVPPKNEYNNTGQWDLTGVTRVQTQKYNGAWSVRFNKGTSKNTIAQKLENVILKKNHKYYIQFAVFTANNTANYDSFIITLTNPRKNYTYKFKNEGSNTMTYGSWTLISNIITTGNIAEIKDWTLKFEMKGLKNSDIFIDSIMLIDLTEAYGTKTPEVSWIANNIGYFEVNHVHPKSDIN